MADYSLFHRRQVLATGAGAAAAAGLQPLSALAARTALGALAENDPAASPFGALRPVDDEATGLPLLKLPAGFRYTSFSWTGDVMADGAPAPPRHDGMAVVRAGTDGTLTLIRNHENLLGRRIGPAEIAYDPVEVPSRFAPGGEGGPLAGGTTRLTWKNGAWRRAEPALGGTLINCAGGPTPWDAWLTGEEVVADLREPGGKLHGFLFEVPGKDKTSARPLTDLGLMEHEAAAVDPETGIVYITEDNGDISGLYRFLPDKPLGGAGSLEAGGRLEMLAVAESPRADLREPEQGRQLVVSWVAIDDPGMLPEREERPGQWVGQSGPYRQGREKGGARFRRLEGCWFSGGRLVFADTEGGSAGLGAIWVYTPGEGNEAGTLEALFVSPAREAGEHPDNLTLRPGGGLVFCEDGSQPNRVMGVTGQGATFPVAENNLQLDFPDIKAVGRDPAVLRPQDYRSSEWAGACFSPDGGTLFVNIQVPGITFAITGPWQRL